MPKTPQQAAQKWANRLTAALDDIRQGVQQLTVSPTELAAQKKDKWLSEIQRAANEGRWEAALRSVTLEDWKQKMLNVGIPRIPDGARSATNKMIEFYSQLLPYIEQVRQAIRQMPDTTVEQRIQRAVEFMRRMAQFKYRRGGGTAAAR